ncbi:MAG: hypothetical protein ACFFDC_19645 [Promethearchaeota archaeon]
MVRKIAILIPMFFLCLGLNNCKSPEEPEKPESYYWYRYNVEVIYSDVAEGESDFPLYLYYGLHDLWGSFNSGSIIMTKIGEKKARCYLPKVLCNVYNQKILHEGKHWVSVVDPNKEPWWHRGENIYVQGAYDLEISTNVGYSQLNFKMSKE